MNKILHQALYKVYNMAVKMMSKHNSAHECKITALAESLHKVLKCTKINVLKVLFSKNVRESNSWAPHCGAESPLPRSHPPRHLCASFCCPQPRLLLGGEFFASLNISSWVRPCLRAYHSEALESIIINTQRCGGFSPSDCL